MWAPICQVGKWQGMFGEVEVTHEKIDTWIAAFGPDEKIPVTIGHLSDPENFARTSTGEPAACWIGGLMKAGDLLLGNYVDWTPAGLDAITSGGYKNPSIESKDGSRLNSVALLGARAPGVEFHSERGRFAPLDMAGPCLGEGGQVLLAQAFGEPVILPYTKPPARVAKFFDDEKGPDAWMKAFNNAYKQYDGDEAKANATAWAQIEEMGYEKGKDGKYRKSKKAAEAAKGVKMAEEQAAKAAEEKKSVLAKLADWLGGGDAPPAEPVVAAKPEPMVADQALAARVDALEKQVKDQAVELQMAGAMARAADLCRRAHLPPKFEEPVGEYLAGKTEITLAPPTVDKKGDVIKEYKISRADFFDRLLTAKGTEKLESPAVLAEPPTKRPVEAVLVVDAGEVSEERKIEITQEAHAEALTAGKGDDAVYIRNLVVAKMNAEVK